MLTSRIINGPLEGGEVDPVSTCISLRMSFHRYEMGVLMARLAVILNYFSSEIEITVMGVNFGSCLIRGRRGLTNIGIQSCKGCAVADIPEW